MLEWVEGMTLLYMAPEVLEPSKDCCSISRGEMEKADLWSFSFKTTAGKFVCKMIGPMKVQCLFV